MAAGSREEYALDLNDIFAFPDGENVPLRGPNTEAGESWVMLLQIADFHPSRQRYATFDITEPLFGRNQIWYKVDDINTVEILPVSLARLWELNDRLRRRSDAGDLFKCLSCGNAGQFGCTVCDSQYCSTECQHADELNHIPECKALGVLRRYNETDWG